MVRSIRKLICLCLAILLMLSCFIPSVAMAADELDFLKEKGVRIGVSGGSVQEMIVRRLYPDAEIAYIDKLLGYTEVAQGKLDAFVYDKMQMELAIAHGLKGVKMLDSTIGEPTNIAFGVSGISEIPDLEEKVNRFIAEIKANGVLDDVYDRWAVKEDYAMPEIEMPSDPRYHLIVGTTGDVEPFSFYKDNSLMGYDIELSYRLAAYLDADVEFLPLTWDSIVPALHAGRADILASNLQVTPERAEELIFSDSLYEIDNGVMVRDANDTGVTSFIDDVKASFEKTFVKEDRYKLFLSGLHTTIRITVWAILLGTLLGFFVFMLCRNGNEAANKAAAVFVRLVQGLPVVVLLMILYYIIFAKNDISGTFVSVIAFTLVFGAGVLGMLKMGVGAIDRGQTEAEMAHGYGEIEAFLRLILRQA